MKIALSKSHLLSVCFCLLFSAAALAVDTDGDGMPDQVTDGSLLDGFETGSFSANPWTVGAGWSVTTTTKYAGVYSAVGVLSSAPTGTLSLKLTKTFAVPTTLLWVEKATNVFGTPSLSVTMNGQSAGSKKIADLANGWTLRKTNASPVGVTVIEWKFSYCGSICSTGSTFYVDDLKTTPLIEDLDDDNDGVVDTLDKFPLDPTETLDNDNDGVGNNADTDDDNDAVLDASDNCPFNSNPDQINTDGDTSGNACDSDDDNDGVQDASDKFPLDPTETLDTDNDGVGNNADTDDDNDGVIDTSDNCPLTANANQADTDGDTLPDACTDTDDDNDGVVDTADKFPLNAAASSDTDLDGFPGVWNASCDVTCQSNSGLTLDNCPSNANANQLNTDGDAQGNVCDTDDDNDGVADVLDKFPLSVAASLDTDNDGKPNDWNVPCDIACQTVSGLVLDDDDDNDAMLDASDNCPSNANVDQLDTDGDLQGNVCDTDNDNDTVLDIADSFPFDISRSQGNTGILYTFYGSAPTGNHFGRSVSSAGDVNNDGYPDVVVGTEGGYYPGYVRVLSGANGSILHTFNASSNGIEFGSSVSDAGDVNNDGYADVIVGAYSESPNGKAWVYSGKTGGILYTFNGDMTGGRFGYSVSGAGDVNNDGYADVIVGATIETAGGFANAGTARVFSGKTGVLLYTFSGRSNGGRFGFSVSDAGDVNRDGYADVVVGACQSCANGQQGFGSASVFSGINGSILYTFNGDNGNDEFGASVSGAGDVNNDDYADIIVGVNRSNTNAVGSGGAKVFSGADGNILYVFNGDNTNDAFGVSVSGAGDINNDGYDDVVVGASFDDNNGDWSGSVRVLSGVDGSILYVFNGDKSNDGYGFSVSCADDVNKDGYSDIIVGASYGGYARILSGKSLWIDTDGDGQNDAIDSDDDSDGVLDINDVTPRGDGIDTDGDGTLNSFDIDDDNDLMPDTWEIQYGLNPLVNDAGGDLDGDGITNLDEYSNGTDPTVFNSTTAAENDFNGDGTADVLLRSTTSGNWQLFNMNNGIASSNSAYAAYATTSWQLVASEDFDADGDTDVLLRNTSTGAWRMFITNNGAVASDIAFNAYTNTAWAVAAVADFNGDTTRDVLLHNSSGGGWRVFYVSNGATTTNANMALYATGWSLQSAKDFDGDGDADIVLRSNADGYWRIFTVQSGVVSSNALLPLYANSGWTLKAAEDLDNDGDTDIVMRGPAGDWRVFNIQNNTVVNNAALGMYFNLGWNLDHLNDVNNDGDADFILRSTTGDWRLFNIQDRAVSSNVALGLYANTAWQTADTVDVDGNGVKDVILNNTTTGAWRAFMVSAGTVTNDTNPGLYQNVDWTLQNK